MVFFGVSKLFVGKQVANWAWMEKKPRETFKKNKIPEHLVEELHNISWVVTSLYGRYLFVFLLNLFSEDLVGKLKIKKSKVSWILTKIRENNSGVRKIEEKLLSTVWIEMTDSDILEFTFSWFDWTLSPIGESVFLRIILFRKDVL